MDRLVVIVIVIVIAAAAGCGPAARVGASGGEGTGGGDNTGTFTGGNGASSGVDGSSGPPPPRCGDAIVDAGETCDDGNVDDLDGCDSKCRVSTTELWQIDLPRFSWCPRLAALEDGGVAIVGNERFVPEVSIPHVVVFNGDASVRSSFQGGHWEYDVVYDVVAEPGGFLVVGGGAGAPDGFIGWMQQWTADGSLEAEAILGMDELGDLISGVEQRDATSYWIVGSADGASEVSLFSRGFAEPPTMEVPLLASSLYVQIARAPDDGVYLSVDEEVGTLSRVDRDGEVTWTLEYPAPLGSAAFGLALTSEAKGDAIVVGVEQGQSDARYWLRRFDPGGNELWRTPLQVGAVPGKDVPFDLAADVTGASYVVGWSQMQGGNDGYLAKYDADGIELWQSRILGEGELNVKPCEVVATSDGSIVVSGFEFFTGEEPVRYWLRAFSP